MRSSIDKENMRPIDHGDIDGSKARLRKTRSDYRRLGRTLEENKAEILRPGDKILIQVRCISRLDDTAL